MGSYHHVSEPTWERPVTAREMDLRTLDKGLDGACLWGLELDTRYRVLAGTVEPLAEHHPYGDAPDRRLQLLLFPCSIIRARLLRAGDDGKVIERFEVGQLVDVVDRLDGAEMSGPVFDLPEPDWGSEVSLRGESSAPDGRDHTFRVHLEGDGGRTLDLYATFDDVQVLTPEGEDVPIALFRT